MPAVAQAVRRLLRSGPDVLTVRRGPMLAAGAAFLILALWTALTAWYFLFQDSVAARLIARQSAIQHSYEQRIADLRAHFERTASQSLLEQNGLENRLTDVAARQARLEMRQGILSKLAQQLGLSSAPGSIETESVAPLSPPLPHGFEEPKPKPAPDSFRLRLRSAGADDAPAVVLPAPRRDTRAVAAERLTRIQRSLNGIEGEQLQTLHALLRTTEAQLSDLRNVVGEVGLDPDHLDSPLPTGLGGPLVPLVIDPRAGPFGTMLGRLQENHGRLEVLRRAAAALPFGRPVVGEIDLTSGYGYRIDPFTRAPAMHTGLDFRAEYGAPVRAAGSGRVVSAEYVGGYGNMVEVDHGNGVVTRYAHLSSMRVGVGQTADGETILGRVGSTGRSTGAHLHYETRVDGEPVDPQRFLRAGSRLVVAQQNER